MARQGVSVVVSGPSGVGKSTLCKYIVEHVPQTMLSVSYTTRRPRSGEQEGVDYCFVDDATFHTMVREDAFVEWAEVYGHRYGTPKQPLLEAMRQGFDVLLDIDTQGARQIMERFAGGVAGAVYVFVAPPSVAVLKKRLEQRASDAPEEIRLRLRRASEEIANSKAYHYLVRNDDLSQANTELASVILAERVKTHRLDPDWLAANGLVEHPTMKEMTT